MCKIINTLAWQLFNFSVIFICIHFAISFTRHVTPRIGPDEKVFPKNLLENEPLLNQHRIRVAMQLFKSFPKEPQTISNNVEVRVVASDRGNYYLFQTITFLLAQQQSQYNLSICNVESKVFPDLQQFNLPIVTVGAEKSGMNGLNSTLRKENEDYWKCLSLPTGARYILLIEDDAIVVPQFSKLLSSLISKLDHFESIDYVKLYHPNNLRKLPSKIFEVTISISFAWFSCCFFKHLPFLTMLMLFIAIYLDISVLGNQFLAEVRFHMTGSAYISYPESCCTPAVIFRKSSVSQMITFFNETAAFAGHAKDHILDESSFVGRQSDINYVTHIGSFSSVRQRSVFLSDLRSQGAR